tara:strand:- start:118 stop:327 length:210 start_codon:yes stop_codon:yes gene_type:complete
MEYTNGYDTEHEGLLSDVEAVHLIAMTHEFRHRVQGINIKHYTQEQYYDVVNAIFDDIFIKRLKDKEKQ